MLYVAPHKGDAGCVFLGPNGCTMSDTERPRACRELKPSVAFPLDCKFPATVTRNGTQSELPFYASLWIPYQEVLDDVDKELRTPKRGFMAPAALIGILEWLRQRKNEIAQ